MRGMENKTQEKTAEVTKFSDIPPAEEQGVKNKTAEQLAVEAYAKDIEAVNLKHNMKIVPRATLEVAYIEEPKPVLETV